MPYIHFVAVSPNQVHNSRDFLRFSTLSPHPTHKNLELVHPCPIAISRIDTEPQAMDPYELQPIQPQVGEEVVNQNIENVTVIKDPDDNCCECCGCGCVLMWSLQAENIGRCKVDVSGDMEGRRMLLFLR